MYYIIYIIGINIIIVINKKPRIPVNSDQVNSDHF